MAVHLTESTLEREPSSEHAVRMRDCDPFGHLHHSRYIDYIFEAREDHLRAFYGLDIFGYAMKEKRSWFVAGTQIRFVSPAPFAERVRVVTRLIDYDTKVLHVEGRMYGKDGTLRAVAWVLFRAVDLATGRPTEHSPDLMDLFYKVVAPIESESFDVRIAALTAR